MAKTIFILRTKVIIDGKHCYDQNKCIPFSSWENAQKVLETIEDSYYHYVTDQNWDCSEDREYDKPNEPLYWFSIFKDKNNNVIEGWIDETPIVEEVFDYEVTLKFRHSYTTTEKIKVAAPTVDAAYEEAKKMSKTYQKCNTDTENGMIISCVREGITKLS